MKTIPVNIHESEQKVLLEAALPGANKDSIDIAVEDNVLTVTAERSPLSTDGYTIYHREFGEVSNPSDTDKKANEIRRSFQLGKEIDKENISADFADGLLTITLLKAQEVIKKIAVK